MINSLKEKQCKIHTIQNQAVNNQRGAVFLEYVIALAGLLAVFVIVGFLIQFTAIKVAKRSVENVKEDVPCRKSGPDILTGEQCY